MCRWIRAITAKNQCHRMKVRPSLPRFSLTDTKTILATWMQFPNSIKHPFGEVETLAAIPQSSDTHTLIDGDAFERDGVQWNVD